MFWESKTKSMPVIESLSYTGKLPANADLQFSSLKLSTTKTRKEGMLLQTPYPTIFLDNLLKKKSWNPQLFSHTRIHMGYMDKITYINLLPIGGMQGYFV